jgi:metallo-beta-lactamase family protein
MNKSLITITPFGAAGGEVTGSAFLIQTDKARILVDCGLFQGGKKTDAMNRFTPGVLTNLDAVLITHGHLDHTGRLPLISRKNIQVPVYATQATVEITALILRDSAHIHEVEAQRINRKRIRAGLPPLNPLYATGDAEQIIRQLVPLPYDVEHEIAHGINAVFTEAGHMLGSACIRLMIEDHGLKRKIIFSGDLGPKGAPILRDYEELHEADMVFLESTYGDRDHRPLSETIDEFFSIVKETVAAKGKILVPTFAVGRTQMLIDLLARMFRAGIVLPFPVFIDSPMAIEASRIYMHHPELFDKELQDFIREKPIIEDLKTLRLCPTAEESKAINNQEGPFMVLAGAGMCNAGRILHHLKYHLWKPETHVIFVGYQGSGTLGRLLIEGARKVKIFGEEIAVKGTIHTLGGFSAHAGQKDLIGWFEPLAKSKPRLMIIHGENNPRKMLSKIIYERFQISAELPVLGDPIPCP